MIDLVTLTEAKHQLRIALDNTYHDADITMKISQASWYVMRWAKYEEALPPEWAIEGTSPVEYAVPPDFKGIVLSALSEAFENREASLMDILSDRLKNLIPRTPTIA